MNLHQLRVFCAVAESQSFSVASAKLHLTQPAITLQIKNLEEYYQLKFFQRAGKKVFLSAEGKVLFEIANQMLDLDRYAEQVVADLKGLSQGQRAHRQLLFLCRRPFARPAQGLP
jgi:DNA-binding transcriptional LysR family regulator